jgi:hypothetical protein
VSFVSAYLRVEGVQEFFIGGINMHGSNDGHPNVATCGLDGGPPSGYLLGELPLGESQGCPPSGG